MSLAHLLIRQARRQPHGDAILHGERVHASHRQWAARSAGLAIALAYAVSLHGQWRCWRQAATWRRDDG